MPKILKFGLTRHQIGSLIAAALIFVSVPSEAFMGECLLEVTGETFLDGPCNIDMNKDGSFSIGTGENYEYFAYVSLDPRADGVAVGWWNGLRAESHAHDPLGNLIRRGGCWINERAKVCAWKQGTRPDR